MCFVLIVNLLLSDSQHVPNLSLCSADIGLCCSSFSKDTHSVFKTSIFQNPIFLIQKSFINSIIWEYLLLPKALMQWFKDTHITWNMPVIWKHSNNLQTCSTYFCCCERWTVGRNNNNIWYPANSLLHSQFLTPVTVWHLPTSVY